MHVSDHSPHPPLSESIELIYRALEDERFWKNFLEHMRSRLQFTVAAMSVTYPRQNGFSFSQYAGSSEKDVQEYLDKWVTRNPWRTKLMSRPSPVGALVPTHELVSDEELMADECWTEFLGPRGMHYGFSALLAQDEFQLSSIYGVRASYLGPLTEAEMAWVRNLLPHLVRAVSLHGRIARLQTERDALLAYSDSMETGIILVNQNGDIHFANEPAETILAKGQELVRRDGRLCATDSLEQSRLETLLLRAGNTLPRRTAEVWHHRHCAPHRRLASCPRHPGRFQ